jgi:hypothetical protein
MNVKQIVSLATLLLAGAAHADTASFYFAITDPSEDFKEVGLLSLLVRPTYREIDVSVDGWPQYALAFRDTIPGTNPNGSIDVILDGQTLEGFDFNYYVCDPNFGNCNFSEVWSGQGQAEGGSLGILDSVYSSASYVLFPTAAPAVPEPSNLELTLAALTLAGVVARRKRA